MKLVIKNKFLSLRGGSKVLDEAGNEAFLVRGKLFSVTKKKYVCDLQAHNLYMVRNKYWHFLTKKAFIYNNNNEKVAFVKSRFFQWGKNKYIVEGYKDELRIDGDLFSFNYQIIRNDEVIGTIKRRFEIVPLPDQFTLDIKYDEDAPFLVALVIAIDNIIDNRNVQSR